MQRPCMNIHNNFIQLETGNNPKAYHLVNVCDTTIHKEKIQISKDPVRMEKENVKKYLVNYNA